MHEYNFFNGSRPPYCLDKSQSKREAIHDLNYPIQPDQLNQLVPSVRNLILDNPSFHSIKHDINQKSQQFYQSVQQQSQLNLQQLNSKSLRLFQSFTQFLENNYSTTFRSSLNVKCEIIWHIISMAYFIFMLIYIPIQYSYQLVQFNIYQIGYLIVNMFVYFRIQQLIKSKLILDQQIQLIYFFKYIFPKDILLIICLIVNYFQINLGIDCLIIIIIIYLSIGKIIKIWSRFCQFKLDFYLENILTLVFKIIIILNTITCLNNLLEKESGSNNSDISFIKDYIVSTQVGLSILTFNYRGKQDGIEIHMISFCTLFLAFYLFYSFHILLAEQGIQIHNFFKSNNFDYVLRERLLNQITKQRYDSMIQFPQRLSDEIKVIQRLPLMLRYFERYDTEHLKSIAIHSEEITYYPSEFIVEENVPDDSSLYFLLDGYAEIRSSSFMLQSICAPNVFGEMSFYTQQPRLASVVALTQCVILKIPRQIMIEGLGQTDKELFHEQKDQISLYSNLPIKCFCCKSNKHCISQCNVFRIVMNLKMTQSSNQSRYEYKRKLNKKLSIIPKQKYSNPTLSPSKTELKSQSKGIPFLYEQNKSEPLINHISNCELKSNISVNTNENLNDKNEYRCAVGGYQQQKQKQNYQINQFKCVQEEQEDEYDECSESYLYTNTLPSNWDVNPPQLYCESKISKIPTIQGENTGIQITVPHNDGMSMSSFQEQATQIQDLQFTTIKDFDQGKLFLNYFPTGNFDIIINKINANL